MRTKSLVRLVIATALALGGVWVAGCCPCKRSPSGSSPWSPGGTIDKGIPIPAGDDRAPATWASPEDSKKQTPSWAVVNGYAPQLTPTEASKLYDETSPRHPDTFSQVMLVCKVVSPGSPDTGLNPLFGTDAPDMDAEIKVSSTLNLLARGQEDRHEMWFTAPVLTLPSSGEWEVVLWDRDMPPFFGGPSRELIANVKVRWNGRDPWKGVAGADTIDCRVQTREQVEERVSKALRQVDEDVMTASEDLTPKETDPSLGLTPLRTKLRLGPSRIAAYVGWADPRVERRLRWIETIEGAFLIKAARLVEQLATTPQPLVKGAFDAGHVTFERMTCAPAEVKASTSAPRHRVVPPRIKPTCVLRLRVRNEGESELDLGDMGGAMHTGWTTTLAFADGTTEPTAYLEARKTGVDAGVESSVSLATGEEALVDLAVGEGADPMKGARRARVVLVQATAGSRMAVVPVEMSGSVDGGDSGK